jgi:hypothetical protein
MKKIIFLSFLLFSFIGFSQQNNLNLKSENLKGNVQSYQNKTFLISKTSGLLEQRYNEKRSFNSNGLLTSIENYGDDTQLDSKETFTYEHAKLSEHTVYGSSGNINKTTKYEYDEAGNLVTQKKYNKSDKLQYQTTFLYNNKGILTAKHKLIPSINYTMKQHYKYNDLEQLIEISKIARVGTTKETFEYNTIGLLSKKSEYNAMGEMYSFINYVYNKQQDKIELKKYDIDGTLTYFENYEYTYDNNGNWIKRTSFEKGVKVSSEKREFTYY